MRNFRCLGPLTFSKIPFSNRFPANGAGFLCAILDDAGHNVAPAFAAGEDVVLYVTPERPDAWRRGEFARLVGEFKGRGIKVLVSCGDDLQVV